MLVYLLYKYILYKMRQTKKNKKRFYVMVMVSLKKIK